MSWIPTPNVPLIRTPDWDRLAALAINRAINKTDPLSLTDSVLTINVDGGFGYGAGGSVTQLTNKTTGVVLNTPNGRIITRNSAIAAGETLGFTLDNSTIAATDVVIVNIASGTSGNSCQPWVEDVRSGQCTIRLRNVTAGTLSETLTLNFAVIKG